MCELYKEMLISLLFLKSNNIYIKKFKIIQFYYSKIFNLKIITIIIKKKLKKITKILLIKYE